MKTVRLSARRCIPCSRLDGTSGWYGLGPISGRAGAPKDRRVGGQLMEQALSGTAPAPARPGVSSWVTQTTTRALASSCVEPSLVLPGVPPEYFQAITFADSLPAGEVCMIEVFRSAGLHFGHSHKCRGSPPAARCAYLERQGAVWSRVSSHWHTR